MKILTRLLPHAQIILSLMLLTFVIIDRFNSAMCFIDNDITKALIFLSALLAVINAGLLIHLRHKP